MVIRKLQGVRIFAPAKINLVLEVLRRRDDGYHDIQSLILPVSLQDEIEVTGGKEGIAVTCVGEPAPHGAANLAYAAAQKFFDRLGEARALDIRITKRIPVGAGLGGGSSDAASTLLALNELFGMPLKVAELMEMGAALGSDVPFFVLRRAAIVTGRGEKVVEAEGLPSFWVLLAVPPFTVSTAEVYQSPKLQLTKRPTRLNMTRLTSGLPAMVSVLRNDLERVTCVMHPEVADLKARLVATGALGALMAGSGGAVFGVFADQAAVKTGMTRLRLTAPWRAFVARTL